MESVEGQPRRGPPPKPPTTDLEECVMFRAIRKLASTSLSRGRAAQPPRPRPRLGVDRLEDRLTPVITDMTAMTAYFPAHDGPSTLWLNFDGCTNQDGHTVAPFTGSEADKRDILYRVSEFFAP